MDTKKEQQKALQHAYAFARSGNFTWCQLWINRAGDFYPVSKRQLNYAQRLYDAFKKEKG